MSTAVIDCYIAESQRAESGDTRIAQAIAWRAEGKRRNGKYEQC